MKKAIFRLIVCVFVLGIDNLFIQKTDANTLEDSAEVKDKPNSQTDTSVDDATSTTESSTSDSGLINGTGQMNEVGVSNFLKSTAQSPLLQEKLTIMPVASPNVSSQSALQNALDNGYSTINIVGSFDVTEQISYTGDFTLNGGGNSLTFKRGGQFFNASATNQCQITFNNLNISANLTSNGGGENNQVAVVNGGDSGTTLTMNDFNYTTTNNSPLATTGNDSSTSYINLVFFGENELNASGSGFNGTGLLQNIGNITVSNDAANGEFTKIIANGNPNSSVIALWTGEEATHEVTVRPGSTFDVTSSKNTLFNLNGNLDINVGYNAIFTYESKGNGSKNNLVGGPNLNANSNNEITNEVKLKVGKNSQTLFKTDGPSASYSTQGEFGLGVALGTINVEADTPKFVEFNSTSNTAALQNGVTVTFKNIGDSTGTSGSYILGETPVSSNTEQQTKVPVGNTVSVSSGSFQDIKYYKKQVEIPVGLSPQYTVGDDTSTIRVTLTGPYDNYNEIEILASPTELSDDAIQNAFTTAQNDPSGKSGYCQSVTVPSNGKVPNFTNVWANTYYLYAQLTNSSTGKTSSWIKSTLLVPEVKSIHADGEINFVGGFGLSTVSTAKLTNAGNTERVLQYSNFTQNAGSSENVSLVSNQATGDKKLLLNVTAENNNSSSSWGPLTLNNNDFFYSQVILSPYWTGSGNSDANFTVNGSYSGPLGKNQIETVSYTLSMNIYTNN